MASKSGCSWSPEEDHVLAGAVKKHGVKKWKAVLEEVLDKVLPCDKNYKQCRERWLNHLDPSIIKEPFSNEEKQQVYRLHQQHGNKWSLIAKQLSGRPDNMVKTFFYAELKKALRRYNKTNPKQRITRTLKSLVRDPQVTTLFPLIESSEGSDNLQAAETQPQPALDELSTLPPIQVLVDIADFEWGANQPEWMEWLLMMLTLESPDSVIF